MASVEAERRSQSFWGARLPSGEDRAAAMAATRERIYAPNQYGGLEQYSTKTAGPLDWRPGESFEAYERRLGRLAQHLPEGEYDARIEAARKNEAWSWEGHRAQVDGRTAAQGIFGTATPQERAAALGNRGFAGSQHLQANGHLAADTTIGVAPRASAASVNGILARQAAEQQAAMQAHTAQVRGASGSGWIGVDNG
jgi:hypothetical protein